MSSSRVIKAVQNTGNEIKEFNFRPISSSVALSSTTESVSTGFTPMELFSGPNPNQPADDLANSEIIEEPLIQISDEELSLKLRNSFNDGLQEGKNLTERGLVNVFRALRGASETIHNLRDKVLRESEDELINLVMLVARKVIIREVAQDRCILAGVVKSALSALSSREEVTIRLNPDDFALLETGREECLQKELLSERLQLKADSTIASGFCQIDTEMGTIDAGLNSQLEAVYRNLIEERTASPAQSD